MTIDHARRLRTATTPETWDFPLTIKGTSSLARTVQRQATRRSLPSNAAMRRFLPVRAGTLYTALDRLCGDGWVAVDHEEVVDGRLRRYYRLSDTGANELAEEIKRLNAIAAAATERLHQRTIAIGGIV